MITTPQDNSYFVVGEKINCTAKAYCQACGEISEDIIWTAVEELAEDGEHQFPGGEGPTYSITPPGPGKVYIQAFIKCDDGTDIDWIYVTVFEVKITNVDMCEDTIQTRLEPLGVSGVFTLELVGSQRTVTLVDRVNRSGGASYNDSFNVGDLPNYTSFTQIKATWEVGGKAGRDKEDYTFTVLEDYRITCYNTPLETDFSGPSEDVCVSNASCEWRSESFVERFLYAVSLNGSGMTAEGEIITIEGWCQDPPDPASCGGAYIGYGNLPYYFRCPSEIIGACGVTPVAEVSVAISPSNPHLSCGDNLYVEGIGCVRVDDHGGGLINTQLDLYGGFGNDICGGWVNPHRKVIRFDE
jgi:hypothetical protein